MFLSLLIIFVIVLIGSAFLINSGGDTPNPPLLKGLGEVRSLAQDAGNKEADTTTVYKWQDESGEWHFSNNPPAEGIAHQVVTYRADTNTLSMPTTPSPGSRPTEEDNDTAPQSSAELMPTPGRIQKLLNDARAVQDLMDNRQQQLDQTMEGNN